MRLTGLVFAIVVYSVIKFMIIGSVDGQPAPEVPQYGEFDTEFEIQNIPSCNEIVLCANSILVIYSNIYNIFFTFIQFLMNVVVYVVQLIIFLGSINIQTIPDAPWYVNVILITPISFLTVMLVFKLLTFQGDDEE